MIPHDRFVELIHQSHPTTDMSEPTNPDPKAAPKCVFCLITERAGGPIASEAETMVCLTQDKGVPVCGKHAWGIAPFPSAGVPVAGEETHQFRKKPVVIEAFQFTEENKDRCFDWISCNRYADHIDGKPALRIQTLEGEMTAVLGDWIIKGVQGEFYPCKPDIFAATYDPVTHPLPAESVPEGETPEVDEAKETLRQWEFRNREATMRGSHLDSDDSEPPDGWEVARRLERERDEARQDRDKYEAFWTGRLNELAAAQRALQEVGEERDKLLLNRDPKSAEELSRFITCHREAREKAVLEALSEQRKRYNGLSYEKELAESKARCMEEDRDAARASVAELTQRVAELEKRLSSIYAEVEGHVDGAPDRGAAANLANSIVAIIEGKP